MKIAEMDEKEKGTFFTTIYGIFIFFLSLSAVLLVVLEDSPTLLVTDVIVLCISGLGAGITGILRIREGSPLSQADEKKAAKQKAMSDQLLISDKELDEITHSGALHPEEALEALIGLDNIKKMVRELKAQLEYDKRFPTPNKSSSPCHMCFLGPPGTGKSSCARIITGLLYSYKRIRRNRCTEIDGSRFVSGVHQISDKVHRIIQHSKGGVLFIDEAYAMSSSVYGSEAIATLLKEMEDPHNELVIIFAGYEAEIKNLLAKNQGFESRIQRYFYFETYSIEELKQIFVSMADARGFAVTEIALERFEELIMPQTKKSTFGNARAVGNCLDASIMQHKVNYIVQKNGEKSEKSLVYEDIVYPIGLR